MMRFVGVFATVTAVGLMLAGCPADTGGGGTGGGNLPPGDPDPSANALLTLNSTVSILQRNASGQTNPAFERSSLLTATLVNVTDPGAFTITWQITALGTAGSLSFSSVDGTPVLQATGPQATVFAVNAPNAAARFRIDALAVSSETSLSSTLQIEVQPDPISAAGESTALSVNPFADPAVGVESVGGVNQVTLFAGDSGPLTRTAFLWEAVDPGSIPTGLALPDVVERDNPTLVLTVTGDVTGVFPFRVTVTDAIGSKQTGVVNVYLGITELTLDIQVRQVLVASSGVTLQTVRAGGATDFTGATDDAFSYTWSAADSGGTNIPISVFPESASLPSNPNTLDSNVIDWDIFGLAAPGVYQLSCTVVDRVGNATNSSVSVAMSDALALTVEPTRSEIGPGVGFNLRTVRSSGTANFTYSFQVFDSSGNDVTAGSGLATSSNNNATNTWAVNGQSPDVYDFRVTVRDGDEAVATASTTVAVVDDLTLSVEPGRTQVGAGTAFTIRTIRDGGRPNFSYSFLVLDQSGVDATVASGLTTTGDNDPDNTWNVAGMVAGTYRFYVTATDGEARQSTASTTVLVGDSLGLNVVADSPIAAPGVPVRFRGQARGGVAPYVFTFAAFDTEGGDAVGDAFSSVTVAGTTGTATYSSDGATALGAYRIRCNVTDALGNTASAAASLFITPNPDLMASARILNPPAAQLNLAADAGLFQASATLNSIGSIPDDLAHFIPSNADPGLAFARNLTVLVTDDDLGGELAVASITFVGVNQRGEVVDFRLDNPATGTTIETTTTPFKRLDRVTIDYTGAAPQDRIEIGIGQRFGVARAFSTVSEPAADRSFVIVATGSDLDTNPENAVFVDPENNLDFETGFVSIPDRQSIRFPALAPNGANDYIVQFVPMTSITVGVQADDLLLDQSNGDVANVAISIFGGVPPYSVAYFDLGSRTDDNVGPGTFNPASPLANVFTGTVVEYTPPAVSNNQNQTVRVLVTDSVGDAAVGYVTISVTP